MKKTLIAAAAAVALTASATAEITFGAWLRALAAPVASDGKDTVTSAGNSWGYGARTARLNVSAVAEDGNAGFNMGLYNDGFSNSGLGQGDEANLWVKPHEMVKVSLGRFDNNTLRGDLCYGSWNWLRPTSSWIAEDEGLFMTGITDGSTRNGFLVEVTPTEELYIQALAPITTTQEKAEDTYKKIRGGFAYTIPETAKIKAQYIGAGDDSKIEAEVDVLAIENLFLGVGFQYNNLKDGEIRQATAATAGNAFLQKMKIALGGSYKVNDQLKVSFSGAFFTYYDADYVITSVPVDPRFQAGVGVDYDLGDGLALSADVRYLSAIKVDGTEADNTDHIAFSAGVTKSVSSNGYIGVAFQGQTNGGTFANNVITAAAGKEDKLTWAIPVAISVWF
ncbi:MAG: OprD family porin [Treponema sp.]|nr:OprD family porin [Treponema sp.]